MKTGQRKMPAKLSWILLRSAFLCLIGVLFGFASPAQAQIGWLDTVNCTTLGGWAYNEMNDTALTVDIYDGNNLIGTALANQFRQDLLNSGIGNGYHGYSIAPPGALLDGNTPRRTWAALRLHHSRAASGATWTASTAPTCTDGPLISPRMRR